MKYEGPLDLKKMPKLVLKAYNTWRGQRNRCNYKKTKSYKYWGGKGITVQYSSREFIYWYINNCPKSILKHDWTVGRIDHSKNYTLNNITFQTRSENGSEAGVRTAKKTGTKIKIFKNGKLFGKAFGTIEAEKMTGINRGNIYRYINGQLGMSNRTKKIPFSFIKEL